LPQRIHKSEGLSTIGNQLLFNKALVRAKSM